jgi:hypothetical protein
MTVQKNMFAVTSQWGTSKTFRLIPLTHDTPYLEAIYDPMSRALILLTRQQKEGFHMVTKLDDNGDPVRNPKASPTAQDPYKKERKALSTSHEAYITEKQEIISFVEMFMYNADYDFKKFMVDPSIITTDKKIITP